MVRLREQAVDRRRRLIYNNDGGDIGHADTVEDLMALRNETVLGTQVDTIVYSTGGSTLVTHLTEVGEIFDENADTWGRNIAALRAAGADTLSATVAFCRAHDLEVFWGHRMNDVHDSAPDAEWLLPPWKLDNPHLLMGTREDRDRSPGERSPRYWWSAMDYEKPEVLDYLCRIQQDVCRRYDIDGVECDFFRTPMFFRPNLDGEPARPEQCQLLTNFQRRLREIYVAEGNRRQRPILSAARVPATVDTCRYVGIDIRRWLEDGLLDLLIVSGGYMPHTEPMSELITLAHSYGVPAFPSVNTPAVLRKYSPPHDALRGAAANFYAAGADGIQLFNHFAPDFECALPVHMTEIGSEETLVGRNKLFVIEQMRWPKGAYAHAIVQSQALPKAIPGSGEAVVAQVPIADDIATAARQGTLASADLRIRISEPGVMDQVEVQLNGHVLEPTDRDAAKGLLLFGPAPDQYNRGCNDIAVRALTTSAAGFADIIQVEVHVIYVPSGQE